MPDSPSSRGPRGPYKRGIERRREVVETAMEVFGSNGFRGGTLQQVAERVGGTPAAILKLFGNKENLLIAVLDHWGTVTGDVVGRDSRGVAHLEGLRRLMAYHVAHTGLLQIYTTMAVEATSAEHPAHRFMTDRYAATLTNMKQLFVDGTASGHFRPMDDTEIAREAEWLLAAMDGLEIQFLINPSFDLERSFGTYVDRLMQRVSPSSPRPAS
ncbi:TetR/AcrR family transcriptional regulator [Planctomonas psychrotolerans]|uniref:TetR/AcrR family transcriptional regulator n=1 Tax=Planctomonas psychrotolerans TaxID=2528712 RepID=UPI0012387A6C|nr:TetR/AcrR family transcriptional regulator [Planctomonas psychrotolerans]